MRVRPRLSRAARQILKVQLPRLRSARSTTCPIRNRSRPNRPASVAPALAGLPLRFDFIALRARAGLRPVSVDVGGRRLARWGLGSGDRVSQVRIGERRKPSLARDDGNGRSGGRAGRRIQEWPVGGW